MAGERLSRSLYQIRQFLRFAQNPVSLLHHLIAERCKAHDPATSFYQRYTKERFQLACPGTERRLRNEARFCSAAEMAVLVQRDEIL